MSYSTATDAELVAAVRRGDKKAFVEIVTRHQSMVCGVALGILGDFSASEDAGQEAFLAAWKKIDQLDSPERLRGWLAQIARTTALGHLRRRRGFETLDENLDVPDPAREPSDAAATHEESELALQALAALPENYRVPLILFYREGQSVRAVAESLGIQEDAVKQRLARGREMLRDRLTGVVETTLTRSKPKAAFTIGVAAAIGALAAPAVIAAGVHTTLAAPVTSFSAKIFPVMNTTKGLVVTGAITAAVCLPVGYHATAPSPEYAASATPIIIAETNSARAKEAVMDSALLAEWRELHDTHGRDADAMPALYKAIADQKDTFRRRAFRAALISEWAQLDPAGAFSFFSEKGRDNNQRQQLLREWLQHNPTDAVRALLEANTEWSDATRGLLVDIAKVSPASIPALVSKIPKAESYWDNSVRDAFAEIATSNLEVAREAAEKITGPNREQALAGVAKNWAARDVDAAMKWARGLPPGPETDEVLRQTLIGRASVDPASALDMISLVPPGGRNHYFATTTGARVLAEAAKTNFEQTIEWIAKHPGRLNHEDMMGIAGPIGKHLNADPFAFLTARAEDGSLAALIPAIGSALLNDSSGQQTLVWEWLRGRGDDESLHPLRESIINAAAWQDPHLALRMADDIPRTERGDEEIKQLAERLFNGGHALHRLDSLLPLAPERLRGQMVQQAFGLLRADTMGDPNLWLKRLDLLPPAARDNGLQSLARAWADKTPDAALAWATALPPGPSHNSALSVAAEAFARGDSQSAARWIGTLPVGIDRDTASSSLVTAIAEKHPREAWTWALSINNPAERERAIDRAVTTIASRDAASARQLVETSPLAEDLKLRLRAALNEKFPVTQ